MSTRRFSLSILTYRSLSLSLSHPTYFLQPPPPCSSSPCSLQSLFSFCQRSPTRISTPQSTSLSLVRLPLSGKYFPFNFHEQLLTSVALSYSCSWARAPATGELAVEVGHVVGKGPEYPLSGKYPLGSGVSGKHVSSPDILSTPSTSFSTPNECIIVSNFT